jgi:hypothetical protein
MNYQTPFPSDIGRIGLAKRCVKAVGIDWEKSGVGKCIEGKAEKHEGLGKEGYELLVKSVEETGRANISTSCTVRIDSKIAKEGTRGCVVDGGVWKGCNVSLNLPVSEIQEAHGQDGHAASDFVRVIEEEYKKLH